MPRVPTYDNFQVADGGVPGARLAPMSGAPRMESPIMPDVAGQQAQRAGQAMQQAGSEVGRIALDMTQQANQVRVNDSMNRAMQAKLRLTYDPAAGFLHLKGDAALTRPDGKFLADEYSEKLQTELDEIAKGLGNDAQRLVFRQQAGQLLQQFQGNVMQHVAREFSDYQIGVQEGTIQTARDQMALAWGDATAVEQSRTAIKAAVVEQGRLKGLPGAQIEANLVAALSPGHMAVITAAADAGKLDYAREYMKQVTAELTPQARLQVQKVLDAGDFEQRTQDAAGNLYAKHGGDTAAALAEARATLSGKDEDGVVARLKALDAERVALRERAQKDAADQAWKLYAAGKRIPPSLLAAMDGKDQEALRRTARAEAEGREVKTDPNIYYALTLASAQDPNFKGEDLRRYFDKLSPADRKHFIDLQAKTAKPEDERQVVGVTEQKNATARAIGLKEKDAGVFHQVADRALYAAQQDKGKPLTQEERQKVLDRLVIEGDVAGRWGNVRLYEAINEGREGTFKPEWSDNDVRKATAALQRRGITKPTQQQIEATIRAAYGMQ